MEQGREREGVLAVGSWKRLEVKKVVVQKEELEVETDELKKKVKMGVGGR